MPQKQQVRKTNKGTMAVRTIKRDSNTGVLTSGKSKKVINPKSGDEKILVKKIKPQIKPQKVEIKRKTKGKIGSSFEDFLIEDGTHEEVSALAVKRVLAWQIEQEMTTQGITKAKMAERMKTSRSQLDRLLDPLNDKVQLDTIHRAASAIGKKLVIGLESFAS